jgi:aspartate/methionine/tyrosine aminotransferase
MLRCDRDDVELAQHLASMQVITTPGSAFGTNTAQMLRINYALDPEQLIPALEVITNELYPH